jgi:hypothetical protein
LLHVRGVGVRVHGGLCWEYPRLRRPWDVAQISNLPYRRIAFGQSP